MTDDPLAGLRAWMQEAATRFDDIDETLCNQEKALMRLRVPSPEEVQRAARGRLNHGLHDISETLHREDHVAAENCACERCQDRGTGTTESHDQQLLAQILRMAKTTAALQRELATVAMERDAWRKQALEPGLDKAALELGREQEKKTSTGQWNVNLALLAENEGLKRELEAERAEKSKCKESYEADV
jgi:hypothetical protein